MVKEISFGHECLQKMALKMWNDHPPAEWLVLQYRFYSLIYNNAVKVKFIRNIIDINEINAILINSL